MICATCLLPVLLVSASADPEVLATYKGGTVTRKEYEDWLLGSGLTEDAAQRRGRLESIALAESLETAARSAGLDRDPRTAFRLSKVENDLLAAALRKETDRSIVITDAEVETELKAEEKERFRPRTVQLRNIYKKVPAGATPEVRAAVRAQLEEIRKQLLAGASFDELAWRESDSQTRYRGGALGYVPAGKLHPDVEKIAFSLKKGELSPVLASTEGFTILRCDDIDEGRVIPLDEARSTIRQGLWSRASLKRQAELRAGLLDEAAPRYLEGGREDAAPVVAFRGGRVTQAELVWLGSGSKDASTPEARRALLQEQVILLAGAARARAHGLDRDEALQARLRWQQARLLATEEISRRINRTLVAPTEAEMRAHYEQNRERYTGPAQVDISLVRWTLDPARTPRQLAEAETVLARLQAGTLTFEQAAAATLEHLGPGRATRSGLVTMPELAAVGPNVFRTVEELAPGQMSGLIQQDEILYVAKLWERRAARPLTFEEVATRVEQEIGDARVAVLQKQRTAEAVEALELHTSP